MQPLPSTMFTPVASSVRGGVSNGSKALPASGTPRAAGPAIGLAPASSRSAVALQQPSRRAQLWNNATHDCDAASTDNVDMEDRLTSLRTQTVADCEAPSGNATGKMVAISTLASLLLSSTTPSFAQSLDPTESGQARGTAASVTGRTPGLSELHTGSWAVHVKRLKAVALWRAGVSAACLQLCCWLSRRYPTPPGVGDTRGGCVAL